MALGVGLTGVLLVSRWIEIRTQAPGLWVFWISSGSLQTRHLTLRYAQATDLYAKWDTGWKAREKPSLTWWFTRTPDTQTLWGVMSRGRYREGSTQSDEFRVVLWPPAVVGLCGGGLLLWAGGRARKASRPHLCPKCGYDLAGLGPEMSCPECGWPTKRGA